MAYTRARPAWYDYPDLRSPTLAANYEQWDQAIFDLKVNNSFYPKDYGPVTVGQNGAVPAGDSLAAINAAVTDAYNAGGGYVPLPYGTMRAVGTLLYAKNVVIGGAGRGATQLYQTAAAGAANLCQSIDNTTAQDFAVLRDFTITGNGNQTNNTGGIVVEKSSYVTVERIAVSFTNNFLVKFLGGNAGGDCQGNRVSNCYISSPITSSTVGTLWQASGASAPDFGVVERCYFNASTGIAFKVDKGAIARGYGAAVTFIGNAVEGWPTIWDIDGHAIDIAFNNFEVTSGTMDATTRSTATRNVRVGNTYATAGVNANLTITDSTTAGPLSTTVVGDSNGSETWTSFMQPAGYSSSAYQAAREFAGTGSPEGVVTALVGSTYRRTNGGALTSFYVKETGTGNTGWVGK